MPRVLTRPSSILDAGGRPMTRAVAFGRGRAAYEAGDPAGQDLGGWHPGTWSPDATLANERQRISDRLHDLVRNDGWASGAVTSFVNTAIGPSFWFSSQPDYQALGISFEEGIELGQQIERLWWNYAVDFRRLADAARRNTMPEFFWLQFRHVVVDGECITLPLWRKGAAGNTLATCFQAVHPARLSNPNDEADSLYRRGGVDLDASGAALAYHIRATHPGDAGLADADYWRWERVPREFSWGRPRVIHYFRADEAEQTRGVSPLAPIVRRLKMNQRYEQAELQAALCNAILAAYIETSLPPEAVSDMLNPESGAGLLTQEERRLNWYEKAPLTLNGIRIPVLPIGDRVNFPTASRPNKEQGAFVAASHRYIAAATGLNPSTISRDYSQTNYSSERAALLEAWRTITWARETFAGGQATPMLACVVEEALDREMIKAPAKARPFWEAPSAWLAGEWIGPPRGWVDPLKEASAAQLRMNAGLSTLRDEAAEQGRDYQDLLRQQARERREREALGLAAPGGVSYVERDAEGNETRIGAGA